MIHLNKSIIGLAKNHCMKILANIQNKDLSLLQYREKEFRKEIKRYEEQILEFFPSEAQTLEIFTRNTIEEFTEIEETKIEKSYRPIEASLDPKAVINLTNTTIPEDVKLAASFGPKFCLDTDDTLFSTVSFIADTTIQIENACPVETHLQCYKEISAEMTKNTKTHDIWTEWLKYRMNKFKQNHPDTLITKSDKGKNAVFIHKDDYEAKMSHLISSNNDYEEIEDINIDHLQNKNNDFVKLLVESGAIQKEIAHQVTDRCCNPAQMYGLIKIHKENHPVRPITSACASPGFKLSKFFTKLLSDIFSENGFHILRSTDITEKIKNTKINNDEILASFDVVSMFTNIPIDLMLSIIQKEEKVLHDNFHIGFELFRDIFIFLLRECAVFMYNGRFFKQKDSLAMGSPLSPILAKILMNDVMSTLIPKIISPKFLALYVDDSLWILNKNDINRIMNSLNEYNERIKFTIETEENGSINFLNMTISRTADGSLITNWYRKIFSSDRLLNYYSRHEKSCAIQTAIAYIKTILTLSDPTFFRQNRAAVETILRVNAFPETLIISILNEHYTLMTAPKRTTKYTGRYVPIKIRNGLTDNIKRRIAPFLKNERLVGVPDQSGTDIFSRIKGKTHITNKTNIIIALACQCEKKLILRHTEYLQRANEIIKNLKERYNMRKGKCKKSHLFNKLRHFQIKNFTLMRRMYELLTYANKSHLIDTKIHLPIYCFDKHLLKNFNDIQQKIKKMKMI